MSVAQPLLAPRESTPERKGWGRPGSVCSEQTQFIHLLLCCLEFRRAWILSSLVWVGVIKGATGSLDRSGLLEAIRLH